MTDNVLIIGANGGIAQAIIAHLLASSEDHKVKGVSRQSSPVQHPQYQHSILESYAQAAIAQYCATLQDNSLDLVICTLGLLHNKDLGIHPEKKIEDLNPEQLMQYFTINALTPALWLKHLLPKMRLKTNTNIVMLSARVGSIADNQLGGWYGYRASKSALNMLVKTAQVEYQRRVPNCDLILYHPGTVDTGLSKPFQRNIKKETLFTPEFTVSQLFKILVNKPETPPPHYLDWNNQPIAW